MSDNRIVYLTISSWTGVVPWAHHYFATLRCGDQEESVHGVLTAAGTRERNKLARHEGSEERYHKGDIYGGFLTKATAIKAAKGCWKEKFPEAKILLHGNHCTWKPMPVLDGPEEFKRKTKQILAECERLGWWDAGNDKQVEALTEDWMKQLSQVLDTIGG